MENLTPAMRQYMKFKNENPDCLVLFRMGDFYETFYDDARLAAEVLEITLTARGKNQNKVPLAGIPYHALDGYLAKLVKNNIKVAIIEQVEDPKMAKGVVKRDLVRIVTPGTVIEENCLRSKENNYLMSVYIGAKNYGLSYVDISTGELFCAKVNTFEKLRNEISKLGPSEIIIPSETDEVFIGNLERMDIFVTKTPMFEYFFENSKDNLKKHFDGQERAIINHPEVVSSCGALISYLKETQKKTLDYINRINYYELSDYMIIDSSTAANLELTRNSYEGTRKNTLLSVLDRTVTAGGGREMKKTILRPLISDRSISRRLLAVKALKEDRIMREDIRENLKGIYDIERLISKVNFGSANPRDLQMLSRSLQKIPIIRNILLRNEERELPMLLKELCDFPDTGDATDLIDRSIKEEPSITIREGNIIAQGISPELDELNDIKQNGKRRLQEIQMREIEATGIKALKVKYNKIFGYFIEVPRRSSDSVPDTYIRKQTQVNSERFITDELKEFEVRIMSAQERINELEYEIYMDITEKIKSMTDGIQKTAQKIAMLDVLCSFSDLAEHSNYSMPEIDSSNDLQIMNGRHPVIERIEDNFIPNDCVIDDSQKVMLITGPNMAGKSTYMRQNALIILMAQIGSFVPADACKMGITDRIFSRVGASDDLSHGQSTFMVEMNETANILNSATERSFVIFDEIGRGTSTYDGVAIAWSVAEHIYNVNKAKTLFATHYHVLNKLEDHYEGIKNYNISVLEEDKRIVFLRKIVRGATDKSYGIHVASLAGVPKAAVNRAIEIQRSLESDDRMDDRVDNYKTETAAREHAKMLAKENKGSQSKSRSPKGKNKDICPDQLTLEKRWEG